MSSSSPISLDQVRQQRRREHRELLRARLDVLIPEFPGHAQAEPDGSVWVSQEAHDELARYFAAFGISLTRDWNYSDLVFTWSTLAGRFSSYIAYAWDHPAMYKELMPHIKPEFARWLNAVVESDLAGLPAAAEALGVRHGFRRGVEFDEFIS